MIRSTTPSCVASSASSSRPPPTRPSQPVRAARDAASRAIRASTAFECAADEEPRSSTALPGLQAQRGGVDRHVRPRLVDDGDHAQRDSNLAATRARSASRPPSTTSPTGSGSAAIARAPSAIPRTRASHRAPAGPSARRTARTRARPRDRGRSPRGSRACAPPARPRSRSSARSLVAESTAASLRAAALAATGEIGDGGRSDGRGHAPSLGGGGKLPVRIRVDARSARPCPRSARTARSSAWKISWSFSSPKRERSNSRWWRFGQREAHPLDLRHRLEHRLAEPQQRVLHRRAVVVAERVAGSRPAPPPRPRRSRPRRA